MSTDNVSNCCIVLLLAFAELRHLEVIRFYLKTERIRKDAVNLPFYVLLILSMGTKASARNSMNAVLFKGSLSGTQHFWDPILATLQGGCIVSGAHVVLY